MKFLDKLQLTYIPAQYWNEKTSGFNITTKEKSIPKEINFFMLWCPSCRSEQELSEKIKIIFPNIPVNKLFTCNIRLALPLDKTYFEVLPILGKIMPISPALKLLFQLQIIHNQDLNSEFVNYSDSIKTWAFLTKLIFELLNRGNFVPILESKTENNYKGNWRLILKSQNDNKRFKTILRNSPWTAFNLPINFISEKKDSFKTNGLWHPSYIFSNYMDTIGDFLIRTTLNKKKFQALKDFYSSEVVKENQNEMFSWDYKFLKSLIGKENDFKIIKFHDQIIPSIIKNWTQITQISGFNQGLSISLELKYPIDTKEDWALGFNIMTQTNQSYPLKTFLEGKNKQKDAILKFFDGEEQFLETILRALGTAANIFPPIKKALESKIPNEMMLNSSEVIDFLRYPKDLLIQSGFNVVLPDVFTKGGDQRLSARLIISSEEKKQKGIKTELPGLFDINSMLNYNWKISLEGTELTEREFKELVESQEPLINWRGDWILIDPNDIDDLRLISEKKMNFGKNNYMEALKLGLSGNIQLQENGNSYEVVVEGDFKEIVESLQSIESFEEILTPVSFNGTLRPYQKAGLAWMGNMCAFNFGLCLADDMGLGKTIQIIAYLLYRKEKYSKESSSTLIICPTSVLFNWKREIKKFAPDLEVILHHGSNRVKDASGIKKYLKPHQIILTSFGTIRNDIDFLQTIPFSGIIVDESQNMKNYASQQTKAILKLQSQFKIALSGTPIENRLIELWTLFEFLNPGLLGTRVDFQKKYIVPIERFQDLEAINRLKLITSPFLLRRVKSDKSVIKDLPDKNEMKIYIELSEIQIKMYKELVDKTLKEIESESADNRKKKGLVLKLLMQLKQLCNHPHQYLKLELDTFDFKNKMNDFLSQSQKLERLLEMIGEVISNGEKALIFSQFKKMGDIIQEVLQQKYNFPILFFHGSVPEKKRREIIDDFQSDDIDSPPILILSLKAGGTGLNLTKGTTVIHFDSPWNPATQDQATDRAYRIGQKQNVNVYKFIAIGTIEEKIEKLLEEKRELAKSIITSGGDPWVSMLNQEELKSLFSLDK